MSWFTRFAIQASFPQTDALPGVADTNLRGFLRDLHASAPFTMRLGLWLATTLYMLTPLFTVFLPVPAFLLRGRLLERHTARLCQSRSYIVRQLVYLLKMVGGLCWGEHAEVRKRFGRPALPEDPRTWQGMNS